MRHTPLQKRSRELVNAILVAAADIEKQYGRQLASTNKIAKRAGVSIGSLYQYFSSKEQIFMRLDEQSGRSAPVQVEQSVAA